MVLAPSMWLANSTPCSDILRSLARDQTWNPPESVRMGFSQVENLCSPAHLPYHIESWAEVEVVGVSEDDLGVNDINQFIGGECFHHSLCADGHENRCGNVTMSCG